MDQLHIVQDRTVQASLLRNTHLNQIRHAYRHLGSEHEKRPPPNIRQSIRRIWYGFDSCMVLKLTRYSREEPFITSGASRRRRSCERALRVFIGPIYKRIVIDKPSIIPRLMNADHPTYRQILSSDRNSRCLGSKECHPYGRNASLEETKHGAEYWL